MSLRNAALAAALIGWGISLALAQPATPTLEMDADGEVQIAPDGHVSNYQLQSKLTPQLANLIDRSVRGWHFEPIVVDGKQVIAKTAMHIRLEGVPASDENNYTVRIVGINFGEPKRVEKGPPPQYPTEAARAGLGAKVLLSLRLDDTGKVVEVLPYQTSLGARAHSEHEAEQWRKLFERASVVAAKRWHYDLSERVNGRPIGTTAWVPVVFSMAGSAKQGQWQAFVPGPVHPAPWMKSSGHADSPDLSLLADGQTLSTDSRFRLQDSVIGKTL